MSSPIYTCNSACRLEVLNGSVFNHSEWSSAQLKDIVFGDIDGKRMPVSVEGTLESFHHRRYADVAGQLYKLTGKVMRVLVGIEDEALPFFRTADGVRVFLRARSRNRHPGVQIALIIEKDAVLIGLYHAVVLHQLAEVAGSCGTGDGLSALRRAEGLRVVAARDGGIGIAGKSPRVFVNGDGQRGRREECVGDAAGGGNVLITRDAGTAA